MSAVGPGLVAALLASAGVYLLYTATVLGRKGRFPARRRHRVAPSAWLAQAGVGEASVGEFVAAVAVLLVAGATGAYVLFGGVLAPVVGAVLAGSVPPSVYRGRRRRALARAAEAWPRMLEELRLLTGSRGRSIPQALFEVGRRAPAEWRAGFDAAEREWLLTTDFPRTVALLKERLSDPTVDAVGETLVVAHEVGGSDLDVRLADLIEDRVADLQHRRDAESRQAGVRFARRFVLLVPLGMALAGLSIGSGRQAYESVGGQIAVACGLAAVVVCWVWSGRLMRLPAQPRVFR